MARHDRRTGASTHQALAGLMATGGDIMPALDPALAPPGAPTQFDWIGNPKSGNGNWNTAADWNPATVPGASATVTFTNHADPYTVSGGDTVTGIVVDGDQVYFSGAVSATSSLSVIDQGGLFLNPSALIVTDILDLAAGTVLQMNGGSIQATSGSADQVNDSGGSIGISGDLQVGTLNLSTVQASSPANFTGDVTLDGGGVITLDTASSFTGDSLTLLGYGKISASLAYGQTSGLVAISDAITFNAGGALNLQAGSNVTLSLSGPISGDGNLVVLGGLVELSGSNSYTGFTQVQGGGTLQVNSASSLPSSLVFLDHGALVQAAPGGNGVAVLTATDTVIGSGTSDTVDASTGGLLVFGGAAALDFVGGASASTVIGGSGVVNATAGNGDVIFGSTAGNDTISAGAGDATIVGGSGAGDALTASGSGDIAMIAGGDSVSFNAADNTGSVTLFGAAGDHTTVIGGAGDVAAIVNDSFATVQGGAGNMSVFGGSGSLALDFIDSQAGGSMIVAGFNTASDDINLSGYGTDAAQQALASETISSGNTTLTLSDNTHIILIGVTNLTLSNFNVS
ncbi:MAG TPA: hypothetical protein VMB71_06685 [Acetobacteraceae bacterium]|nr:hypothetical protein [Acetobacteraceae bacterium]